MGFFLSSWPSPASALHLRAVASALPFSLFVLGDVCAAGSGMGWNEYVSFKSLVKNLFAQGLSYNGSCLWQRFVSV